MIGNKSFLKYTRKLTPTVFDSGIGARLPAAYRKFYEEWKYATPEAVHYIPHTGNKWVRNEETGEVKRIESVPIPERFPKELHKVFTGGEAVVQGFVKKSKYSNRVPRFWVPKVYRSVIYSEILNKYLSALITKRVIELIHKHEGLDNYLLKTRACDLKSLIALKLKQRLLLALHNRDFPYDEEKNKEIFLKYEKYLIPPEEIEWFGLSFSEACSKLKKIEEAEKEAAILPLKHVFRAELIKELKESKELEPQEQEKPTNWFKKLPGLRKDSGKN